MNSQDVGRGRRGVRAALGRVTAPTLVAGVDSDRPVFGPRSSLTRHDLR
ncbi:hypothetical protein ACFW5X_17970 [Streptomyces albogriseolus]